MAELQRISNDCGFENLLDKMLVRRFICGIRDEALQSRFLQEDENKLTKRTVLDTATAAENEKAHQANIKDRAEKESVKQIGHFKKQSTPPRRLCWRCVQVHILLK